MLLSDVVNVLGDQPLSEFPWGCVVRDTVNLFAEKDLKLTLTSSGSDLQRALSAMSEDNRTLLNRAQLDTGRARVIQPVGGGMVLEHADDELEPSIVFNRTSITTAMIVGSVILISVFMLSSLSINKDTDWNAIKDIVVDIGKILIGS